MHVWHFLNATKHQGQAHGIDSLFPHHQQENLIVHCPSCLKIHINLEPG